MNNSFDRSAYTKLCGRQNKLWTIIIWFKTLIDGSKRLSFYLMCVRACVCAEVSSLVLAHYFTANESKKKSLLFCAIKIYNLFTALIQSF